MTTREKVAHLLRRFGLGATQAELDRLEYLGVPGAIDALLDYEKTPDDFSVSVWEFVVGNDENINLDASRFLAWWALRLVMTKRPVEEKLAVFWHDHFAVSASKVGSGPAMHEYNEALRKNACGNFRTMLGDMTKDPAMLRWLDGDASIKGSPNENYAREVLELFTMGIGNYTEKDIQELARAFTGWSLRAGYRNPPRGGSPKKALMDTLSLGLPFVASSYSDGLHDEGPKTILGKTANFDTESALDHIVSRPQTARYITKKLWEFFAYPEPDPKLVERLAKVFTASKYEIKPVLRAIAESPEFWSPKCVRQKVKSPLDFTVALLRQLELGDQLRAAHKAGGPAEAETMMMGPAGGAGKKDMKPIPAALAGTAYLVMNTMTRQGMRLYYPPDVAGWDWGEAWVSPAMMAERMRFAQVMVAQGGRPSAISNAVRQKLLKNGVPETPEKLVQDFAWMFDAPLPQDRMTTLVEAVNKAGGVAALRQPQSSAILLQAISRLTFGMPEFQLC
jgi:uncharacterized protein (DUF1800 family)